MPTRTPWLREGVRVVRVVAVGFAGGDSAHDDVEKFGSVATSPPISIDCTAILWYVRQAGGDEAPRIGVKMTNRIYQFRLVHVSGLVVYVNGTTYAMARRASRSIFRRAGLRALDCDIK